MKKFKVALTILAISLLTTGCTDGLKEKLKNFVNDDTIKNEQVDTKQIVKDAKKQVIQGDYQKADEILIIGLLDYPDDKRLVEIQRQVKSLKLIEKDMKLKKYQDAYIKCNILILDEDIDETIKIEVEKLQEEVEKLSGGNLEKKDNKNRNIKIDNKKDITPSKALEIALDYSKKNFKDENIQCVITDIYSIDDKGYYCIYIYSVNYNQDGYYGEKPIATLEIDMEGKSVLELLIYENNENKKDDNEDEVWIGEAKAIEKIWKYIEKNGMYVPTDLEICDIYSYGEDTFYYIEAYYLDISSDDSREYIYIGSFDVNVITGDISGYTKKTDIQDTPQLPETENPPQDNNKPTIEDEPIDNSQITQEQPNIEELPFDGEQSQDEDTKAPTDSNKGTEDTNDENL